MAKKDNLFNLIKSLNRSEKRYFKLFTKDKTINGKNNHHILFNLIDKMEGYDEELLKKKLRKEPKILNFLASIKYQLYNSILRSMHIFHAQSSVEAELGEALHQIEFLRIKKLYDQALGVIKKAKVIAEDRERFTYLMEFSFLEIEILREQLGIRKLDGKIEQNYIDLQIIIDRYKNFSEYKFLYQKTRNMLRAIGDARTERQVSEYNELTESGMLNMRANTKSKSAFYYYTLSNIIISFSKNKYKKAYAHTTDLMFLLKLHPEELQADKPQYIGILHFHIMACLFLDRLEEAEEFMVKFKEIEPGNRIEEILWQERYYRMMLYRYYRVRDFEKAIEVINEFKESGLQNELHQDFKLLLNANCVSIMIASGNFKEALKWNNLVLNHEDLKIREDIYSVSKVKELLIHFELKNFDLLEYKIKSTYNYLNSREKLYKTEKIFLKYISKVFTFQSKKEIFNGLKELHGNLSPLKNDKLEKHFFTKFDFVDWLEKKMEEFK